MIQALSVRFKKPAAYFLFMVFYLQFLVPLYAAANSTIDWRYSVVEPTNRINFPLHVQKKWNPGTSSSSMAEFNNVRPNKPSMRLRVKSPFMGGPSSPEAASFKAVGSNNLVNLFTGDFSYSIPLLDVGGYPVNLFYSAGIEMEQEASWVGLGWNINPGTVSRNMRGIPDDFDGTDFLTQTQKVKANRTFGGEVAADGELLGLKEPKVGFSLGFSYNNYLGPEITTGASVSVSLPILENIKGEKAAQASTSDTGSSGPISIGIGAKLSSRSGLTLSPSLNASLPLIGNNVNLGIGLSTSYNSRSGISALNLHSEASFSKTDQKMKVAGKNERDENIYSNVGDAHHRSFMGLGIGSTSITFAKPSYVPSLRMPMENSYTSGQVEFGAGAYGLRASFTLNGFYTESKVPAEMEKVTKPLVGYMYSEKAASNINAVMDFNRVNDAEVTPNTPVVSAPMYTYDVFSIQGEGTGGSIRAYRGDLGFMRDNETVSKDKSLAIGADIAPPGHYGVNVNKVSSPTRVGGWEDNNNTLRQTMSFQEKQYGGSFEDVYFRNPSEGTVANDKTLERIGYDNLVRFKLGGSGASPRIESQLESFGKKTSTSNGNFYSILGKSKLTEREKRTQVITMLNAEDAGKIGLDPFIKTYKTGTSLFDANDNHLVYDSFPRVNGYRKKNHISEIDVLEQNGMRYVYGIPVYNKIQKDFTFSVGALQDANNLVTYNEDDAKPQSEYMKSSSKIDGYLEVKETPAYASSFLLTGLLSPDYVDVTGNGITEDDLGGAVKFNYTQSDGTHKWRTPRNTISYTNATIAHFNEGKRTEMRDNKATITFGEREAWYLNSIESKSMIAVFAATSRDDAKGVVDEMNGNRNIGENTNLKLSQIDLYTKADIRANGIKNAKPVKSVYFEYSYALCKGTPDNSNGQGKLTLTAISFGYNGQPRTNKERYVFNYGNTGSQKDNPDYGYNASDRWGTYKPAKDSAQKSVNPGDLSNLDYPFTVNAQDGKNKTEQATSKQINDQFAAVWSLRKILLPSGGQMEMQYEADDYAYVQDRRACNMYSIYGLGKDINASTNNTLYSFGSNDNFYVYVKLPTPLQNTDPVKRKAEIYAKYLESLKQLLFKLQIVMPKGAEPLTLYATGYDDYGLCSNSSNNDIIYLKLSQLDGKSPLTKSAIGFLVNNLTGQAFPGYDASETNNLGDFLNLAGEMFAKVTEAFKNTETQMRDAGNAREIILARSFVRLASPGMIKYGGGLRVKQVLVRDNWDRMTKQYASTYGQDYDYTTTQKINGVETTISSGVASYEPGIGSEENPFREIINYKDQLPLASAMYGAIEMPILETMYPSPLVGYSKVTVRSIHRKGTHADSTLRSAIGKQVTEFYTAKEYPSYSAYTDMNTMDYHKKPFFSFFSKEIVDRKIVSQGFLVENNDMHGKMKSQTAYSESDEKTPLSYSYHTYKNTGKNGLNDKVDFVFNKESGAVRPGTMGVDMELMTDVREFSVMSNGSNTMGQVDIFFIAAISVPIPTIYPAKTYIENKYRAVTCTKLINYHAIEDTLIVMDKGSVVKTRTIAYDAETGTPLVTQTENEFNDPIYTVSYPAHWAYSGAGPAYTNIGTEFKGVSFIDGRITSSIDMSMFESGDELYVIDQSKADVACPARSAPVYKLWAFDKNKNNTALTVPVKDFIFIDSAGNPYTNASAYFRIVRSGRRNNLPLTVSSATSMGNPIREVIAGQRNLVVDAASKVVAASAISFKEKWQTDIGVINNRIYYKDGCVDKDSIACEGGILEKKINPYLKGLIGNLKPYRSYTYYGSRTETDPAVTTNIRKNGYINGFGNYWLFNTSNNLVPDDANANWVWNSELTKANAKGQELETKDALNRYTAAQYGYAKNLPVAMSQNARLGESFYEGFEDYDYVEALNPNVPANCNNNRYANFADIQGSSIIPSIGHTGKYVMQVGSGQAVKELPIVQAPLDNFSLDWIKDVPTVMVNQGGNYNPISRNGSYYTVDQSYFNNTQISVTIYPETGLSHSYSVNTNNYIQITTKGTYNFKFDLRTTYSYWAAQKSYGNQFTVIIYDLDNNIVNLNSCSKSDMSMGATTLNYSVDLCPGIYRINGLINEGYQSRTDAASYSTNLYMWQCLNCQSQSYQSLSKQNGCEYTKPLAATNDMLNQRFALVPGKRMQFSAWVKEKCDSVVCYKPSYIKNHVELQFPGASTTVTLKPSGNIIEGWQKIEGEFTVPANATSANLVLSNDGTQPVYFDDIRIHPFNANMKSYVYDNRTLRLSSELDENNYASFYEYDEEGQLIRIKKETIQGIKTIKETRSAKQRSITDF